MTKPIILTIAGSDSGGCAGIQADIKTITQLGGFAASTITAVTVQNTQRVADVHPVPANIVQQQIELAFEDFDIKAVKIGMVHSSDIIEAIAGALNNCKAPIILDPVMISTSGNALMDETAVSTFKSKLIPLSTLLTPNLMEMEALTGETDADIAAEKLLDMGTKNVLIKGGHAENQDSEDILYTETQKVSFSAPRIQTTSTHGTGCTLSAAIASQIGFGEDLVKAIKQAKAYVWHGLKQAPGIGHGNGPLEHKIDNISDCVSVKDHV